VERLYYPAWVQHPQENSNRYDIVFDNFEDDGIYTLDSHHLCPFYLTNRDYLKYEVCGEEPESYLELDQRNTSLKRESALLRKSRTLRRKIVLANRHKVDYDSFKLYSQIHDRYYDQSEDDESFLEDFSKSDTYLDEVAKKLAIKDDKPVTYLDKMVQKKPATYLDQMAQKKSTTYLDQMAQKKPAQKKPTTYLDKVDQKKSTTYLDKVDQKKPTTYLDQMAQKKPTTCLDKAAQKKPATCLDKVDQRKPTRKNSAKLSSVDDQPPVSRSNHLNQKPFTSSNQPFRPNQKPPFRPNQQPPFRPNQQPPFRPNQQPPFRPNQ